MDAELVAALKVRGARPIRILELGGKSSKFCDKGHYSSGGGAYRGSVHDWGQQSYSWNDRTFDLELPTTQIIVNDFDGTIAASFAAEKRTGAYAEGAAVTIKLGAKTVAYSKWYTCFSGVLSGLAPMGNRQFALVARQADLALRRDFPRSDWKFGNDWPNCDPNIYDLTAPIRFGRYDSSSRGGGGAVKLFKVDTLTWVSTAGVQEAMDRVYDKGNALLSGWSSTSVIKNGRAYSIVTLTDPPQGDLTADMRGLTTTGTGGGTLITNPIDAAEYALVQFCLGSWQSGAWLSSSSYPISSSSFTAVKAFLAKLANGGHVSSVNIEKIQTGLAFLKSLCSGLSVGATWSDDGKIAFAFEDHTEQAYPSTWVRVGEAGMGQVPRPMRDSEGLIDRVSLVLPAGLSFDVYDPTARIGGVPAADTVPMVFAGAYL